MVAFPVRALLKRDDQIKSASRRQAIPGRYYVSRRVARRRPYTSLMRVGREKLYERTVPAAKQFVRCLDIYPLEITVRSGMVIRVIDARSVAVVALPACGIRIRIDRVKVMSRSDTAERAKRRAEIKV